MPSPIWRESASSGLDGATISMFGSFITRMALPFVAILVLDAGAIEVAYPAAIELVAGLVVGLVAGAWVDRLRRRPVLIWADLGRAAHPRLGAARVRARRADARPAARRSRPWPRADNVRRRGRQRLPADGRRARSARRANGALAASASASEFSGFGAGGVLVQALTAPIAIPSTPSRSSSRPPCSRRSAAGDPAADHAEREPVLAEIREGLRIALGDPMLRAFVFAQMALSALWGVFGSVWLLFATRELGLEPAAIGLIAGAGGFGSFLGAVLAGRMTRRFGVGPVAIAAMLVAALGNLLIPLAPAGAPLVAVGFLLGQQLVGDSAITMYEVTETSVRQAFVHDRALGRVASSFRVAAVLAQLAATIGGGLFAEAVGLRAAAFLAPLGGLVAAAALWWSPVRHLRTLPAGPLHGPVSG